MQHVAGGLDPVVMNAACICATAGPSMRKCVSRQWSGSCALPVHSSAMPTPPVKPTRPSTTSSLRCVRLFMRAEGVPARAGGNLRPRRRPPSSRSSSPRPSSGCRAQSSSTCTLTPARARSASASANCLPIVARPVDVGLEVDASCCAPRIASSMAGKIWSPLTQRARRGCRGTSAGPSSTPMARRNCGSADAVERRDACGRSSCRPARDWRPAARRAPCRGSSGCAMRHVVWLALRSAAIRRASAIAIARGGSRRRSATIRNPSTPATEPEARTRGSRAAYRADVSSHAPSRRTLR